MPFVSAMPLALFIPVTPLTLFSHPSRLPKTIKFAGISSDDMRAHASGGWSVGVAADIMACFAFFVDNEHALAPLPKALPWADRVGWEMPGDKELKDMIFEIKPHPHTSFDLVNVPTLPGWENSTYNDKSRGYAVNVAAVPPVQAPAVCQSLKVLVVQHQIIRSQNGVVADACGQILDLHFYSRHTKEPCRQFPSIYVGWDFAPAMVTLGLVDSADLVRVVATTLEPRCRDQGAVGALNGISIKRQNAHDGLWVSTLETGDSDRLRMAFTFIIDVNHVPSTSPEGVHWIWQEQPDAQSPGCQYRLNHGIPNQPCLLSAHAESELGPFDFKLVDPLAKGKGISILPKGGTLTGRYTAFTGPPVAMNSLLPFFVRPRSLSDVPDASKDVFVVSLHFSDVIVQKRKYLAGVWKEELALLKMAGLDVSVDASISAKRASVRAGGAPKRTRGDAPAEQALPFSRSAIGDVLRGRAVFNADAFMVEVDPGIDDVGAAPLVDDGAASLADNSADAGIDGGVAPRADDSASNGFDVLACSDGVNNDEAMFLDFGFDSHDGFDFDDGCLSGGASDANVF
jgi:hypothetical protein